MNRAIFIYLLASVVLTGCKKTKVIEYDNLYNGSATAIINGKITLFNKVRAIAGYKTTDTIGLSLERWDGLTAKEGINFNTILKNRNIQIVRKINYQVQNMPVGSTYATLWQDGDVLCDFYHVNNSDSLTNCIAFTSIDNTTNEITGTFNVTYIRDRSREKCYPNSADTVRITNGQFKTKIFN